MRTSLKKEDVLGFSGNVPRLAEKRTWAASFSSSRDSSLSFLGLSFKASGKGSNRRVQCLSAREFVQKELKSGSNS